MSEAPKTIPGNPPPSSPPADWEKKWKFKERLYIQNPTLSIVEGKTYVYPRDMAILAKVSPRADTEDTTADDAKKRARVAAIKAANRAKRKSWNTNVSGTGTIPPILGSYPSGEVEQAGTGFSWSDIPSIVWIVLAVAGGIFLIKSAGKGRRR